MGSGVTHSSCFTFHSHRPEGQVALDLYAGQTCGDGGGGGAFHATINRTGGDGGTPGGGGGGGGATHQTGGGGGGPGGIGARGEVRIWAW